jgi:hypothetical protein
VQVDEFTAEIKPCGQVLQAREPLAENVPEMQVWHMLDPASGAKEPAWHVMQDWLFEERL